MRYFHFKLATFITGCLFALSNNAAELNIEAMEQQWAICQYQQPSAEAQIDCYQQLIKQLHILLQADPNDPKLNTLLASNLASLAGVEGASNRLTLIREAKNRLEQVITKAPDTFNGAAYTILGTLYYRAPGWPISFGDDDKAKQLLTIALKRNPDELTTNYFYADFLAHEGKKQQAITRLKQALTFPIDPTRRLATEGRKQDIAKLLTELEAH